MKKVSIALLFLALLLVVVGAQWRRAIGWSDPMPVRPFATHAGGAAPDHSLHPADLPDAARPITLPVITLPAGCGVGCNALVRSHPRII